ncbi:TraR/DksA C4-type zinc finger protein [Candidatus Contubernalis alkaliaceticus]|uniref:TraR/DksA C4-type zinc finger protein n=1 Tax=Candidatus Contubernalis alkaliaceticus TaxID=338645 RepID=UPI001F4BDC69|nr:TraR/DksA C4-type zinc finger protein [Candidatus Contubernalis alkalaceticus]UNC92841.1 TraR/DksA C4-type zinc finger protein [Candidatus Contubernalis alkalaceticus]
MNQYFYQRLKEMEKQITVALDNITGIGAHESFRDSVGELSLYDNHPADLGSENFDRSKDLSLHESRLLELQKIRRSLKKIEKGIYGSCASCGKTIENSRLEALPYADLCINCAEKAQGFPHADSRPVEEEVLDPPLGKVFKDRQDYVGFDGEDAWQQVAEFNQLPHVHYEDVDPGEDLEGPQGIENIPTAKDQGGTFVQTYWKDDRNFEQGKKPSGKNKNNPKK